MKLKTIFLHIVCLSLFSYYSFGQANCDAVKKENEYLRNALKVNEPILTENVDKIEIRLVKVFGDIKSQSVVVEFLFINHAANKNINLESPTGYDLEGNQFDTNWEGFKIGVQNNSAIINTDVPVKGIIRLKRILPSIPILKLVKFDYNSETLNQRIAIEFKDVNIDWK